MVNNMKNYIGRINWLAILFVILGLCCIVSLYLLPTLEVFPSMVGSYLLIIFILYVIADEILRRGK